MQSIQAGAWISPQGYGGVVPSKPPLMHWLAVMSAEACGLEVNEFTARLPSALAALFFVLYFYLFLRRERGAEVAFGASLLLLTAVEWFRAAISARVDMLLSALLAAGLLTLLDWYRRDFRSYPFAAVMLLAGATLTKGPVSIVLPAAIFGAFLLVRGVKIFRIIRLALLVFLPVLMLSSLWYAAAMVERPEAFISKFYYENVQRFLGTQEDEPHRHSALYLFTTLALGFLPWTLFYSGFVTRLGFRIRTALPFKSAGAAAWRWLRGLEPLPLLSLITITFFLIFFALPAGKRSVYLLPVYPFIAWWLVELLSAAEAVFRARFMLLVRIFSGIVILLYGVTLLIAVLPLEILESVKEVLSRDGTQQYFAALAQFQDTLQPIESALLLIPLIIAVWIVAIRPSRLESRAILAGGMLIFALELAANALFIPLFANSVSPQMFSREIAALVQGEKTVYSYNNEYYGVSFYLKKNMARFEVARPEHGLVLLKTRDLEKFKAELVKGQTLQILKSSDYGIIKPADPASLARF